MEHKEFVVMETVLSETWVDEAVSPSVLWPSCLCGSEQELREKKEKGKIRWSLACRSGKSCTFSKLVKKSHERRPYPFCHACFKESQKKVFFIALDIGKDRMGPSNYFCKSCRNVIDKVTTWVANTYAWLWTRRVQRQKRK